jgi:sterol desaturase/sphingolipid hydroxylase (fatty acid hydroxylase superfamily)
MSISRQSIINFVTVNSILFFIGFVEYKITSHHHPQNIIYEFIVVLLTYITRNYSLLNFIDYSTKNKPKINNDITKVPVEVYKNEFHICVITTTTVEAMTYLFINRSMINLFIEKSIDVEIIYFIPISFVFEIIFDFFHYLGHRALHHKSIYKYLHKKHHKFNHPTSIITFYQDPIDLVITNSIPTILAVLFMPRVSRFQFHLLIVYKNFIEIGGHVGNVSFPTSSFPQCIWLPKLLQIELYTEDHDLHHSENNCNYSKRFSLWDKVFGTYSIDSK